MKFLKLPKPFCSGVLVKSGVFADPQSGKFKRVNPKKLNLPFLDFPLRIYPNMSKVSKYIHNECKMQSGSRLGPSQGLRTGLLYYLYCMSSCSLDIFGYSLKE